MGELKYWTEVIKENAPQTLIKPPAASDISNGCCRTGLRSGININFCPVINPTINPTISPTFQPQIKPIICSLSSDGLWKMESECEPTIEQQERIGFNPSSTTSICACDKGEQNQIDPVILGQRHSSLQPESKSCCDHLVQEPSKTLIINNYSGSEYSSGACAGYLQRQRQLSESFRISR
jgi:hypothetical protein